MHRRRTLAVLALGAVGLGLVGCAETLLRSGEPWSQAATIKEVKGTNLKRGDPHQGRRRTASG